MSIMYGTLSLDTGELYYVYLKQNKKDNTWLLLQDKDIISVLKVFW